MTVDLIVVGAGHAGVEAAAAAARMGLRVTVVTMDPGRIAVMPCNPAIGGVGKAHLVAELDALGGLQGWAADRAGIQFKTLNRSRGPAVWGPRAQCDKLRYSALMARLLRGLPGVEVVAGEAEGLLSDDRGVTGVRLRGGLRLAARGVVVTTGTFLGGVLHTGRDSAPGGRDGEPPSAGLGDDLERLGLARRRFKTGTPPRLRRSTLDLARLRVEPGDARPRPFSWRTRKVTNRIVCWSVRTPEAVQEIVNANLHRSPLYGGRIEGVGPRYCPSIEDKVVRFPHHREHTLFLEPEGEAGESIYVNGLSTSLPKDVQEAIVHAVAGLERAEVLRYGYAVEYDVVVPASVDRSLRAREVPGLWLAGQVLGTSGYEEAAALGLLAGVNAACSVRNREPVVLRRDQGYLGVLVDDLVRSDHREPYRMLTSRAEHRLRLGVDSARERLMARGHGLGLVPERAFHVEQERWRRRRRAQEELASAVVNPSRAVRAEAWGLLGVEPTTPTTWGQLLIRHDVDEEDAAGHPLLAELPEDDRRIVLGRLRYAGYLARHDRESARLARLRQVEIPPDFEPRRVSGLSGEAIAALERERPGSLGAAAEVAGMTPSAVALLAGWLVRRTGGERAGGR